MLMATADAAVLHSTCLRQTTIKVKLITMGNIKNIRRRLGATNRA